MQKRKEFLIAEKQILDSFCVYERRKKMKLIKTISLLLLFMTLFVGCRAKDKSLDDYYRALPEATDLVSVDISSKPLSTSIKNVFEDKNGAGYSIMFMMDGYAGDDSIGVIVGVSKDNVVKGVITARYNDSKPLPDDYNAKFIGKDLAGIEAVDTVAGVTVSSTAYRFAVSEAVKAVAFLNK